MFLYIASVAALIPAILAYPQHMVKRDSLSFQIFPAGNCADNAISVQTATTPFQNCYNFPQGGNYGGMFTSTNPNCRIKTWELPNCHGKASIHVEDTQCIPIANKDNVLYILDGTSSLSIDCDPLPPAVTVTVTLPASEATTTTTLTAKKTYTKNEPWTSTSTLFSARTGTVANNGMVFGGQQAPGLEPGSVVVSHTTTEVRVTFESITVDDQGKVIPDGQGYKVGDKMQTEKGATGDEEGDDGEDDDALENPK